MEKIEGAHHPFPALILSKCIDIQNLKVSIFLNRYVASFAYYEFIFLLKLCIFVADS